MGLGRFVTSALGALSAFNRSGRGHDQEADGESNRGQHHRNEEEIVGN